MLDLSAAMQGFLLALGLFICPGPKDVLAFREALLGRSRAMLVAIGSGSDLVLTARLRVVVLPRPLMTRQTANVTGLPP
jgi:arginine exporter protein ArgO